MLQKSKSKRKVAVSKTKSKKFSWNKSLAGISYLQMAITYSIAWIFPESLGLDWIKSLVSAFYFEQILIHATGTFTMLHIAVVTFRHRVDEKINRLFGIKLFSLLGLCYLLFSLGVSYSEKNYSFFMVTIWLIIDRARMIFAAFPMNRRKGKSGHGWGWAFFGWVMTVMMFYGTFALTSLLPIPYLGITAEMEELLKSKTHQILASGVITLVLWRGFTITWKGEGRLAPNFQTISMFAVKKWLSIEQDKKLSF